jgi:HD superfamily phosphodiesterase
MQGAVDHFGEKLERLEGMMKTGEGRRMARERTRRVEVFRGWWEEECGSFKGGGVAGGGGFEKG